MKPVELRAEVAAALKALTDADRDLLVKHGVDFNTAMGLVGTALVRVERGLYSPAPEGGMPAFLTPCRIYDAITPESSEPSICVRRGEMVDIVAWHPKHPSRWALRVGTAEWLGAIGPQYADPPPVPIHRSPLSWFQDRCVGLVPLSRVPGDIYRLLNYCSGEILAEDLQHAADLQRVLDHPWSGPRVLVRRGGHRHAA